MFNEDLLAALQELLEASSAMTSGQLLLPVRWNDTSAPANGRNGSLIARRRSKSRDAIRNILFGFMLFFWWRRCTWSLAS